MLKRIISILLSLTVIFSFGLTASAARGNGEISPNYLYTLSGYYGGSGSNNVNYNTTIDPKPLFPQISFT